MKTIITAVVIALSAPIIANADEAKAQALEEIAIIYDRHAEYAQLRVGLFYGLPAAQKEWLARAETYHHAADLARQQAARERAKVVKVVEAQAQTKTKIVWRRNNR